jgi:hypothetical protein
VKSTSTKQSAGKKHQKRPGLPGARPIDRVEALLFDLANLPLHPENRRDFGKRRPLYDRMLTQYPEIFDFSKDWKEPYRVIVTVRHVLRRIWDTRDERLRDWLIFELRDAYQRSRTRVSHPVREFFESMSDTNDLFGCVPEKTPFDAAMVHLQTRLAKRMLHCPDPACPAPYFFRNPKEKKTKSCSTLCGNYLRKQSKLRYYHDSPTSEKNRGKV